MTRYPLCAIDLDDTLLDSDHRISDRNLRAVRAADELGVNVIIASGRMHESTVPYVNQLGLSTPVISYNGAMVRLPNGTETWLHKQIPAEDAATVLEFCRQKRLQLNFYLNDCLYSAEYTGWLRLYYERTHSPIEIVPDFYDRLNGERPTKLIIVDSPEVTARLLETFRATLGNRLYITRSNDEYLEFMPLDADKGRALEMVANHLGISRDGTVAFGDSWNDLPMIRWAGLGIAVSNGRPELLQAADEVTLSNRQDGVAVGLERLYGVGRK
ncbi:MAG TPA: Cof-type HAD-IIB family hydrolase [Chthonomonadales bacterium]|nr:Cof-type HAD-IIB family hydrolase [Chthonomonadales bacterium]